MNEATSGTGATGGGEVGAGRGGTGGSGPSGGLGGTGGAGRASCATTILATNDSSYGVRTGITLKSFNMKPSSELTLDWSGLTHNLAGDPLDPVSGIDDLLLSLTHVSPFELSTLVADSNISADDLDMMWELRTGAARSMASTFDLTPVGATMKQSQEELLGYFDPSRYSPDSHSYIAMLSKGTSIGFGVQALALIVLNESFTETTITLDDETTRLSSTTSPPNVPDPVVPVGFAGVTVDFEKLTQDTGGHALTWQDITRAELIMTSADLDQRARDALLDVPRDHVWRGGTVASSLDLATLTDDDGNAFAGIDQEHGWLLALYDDRLLPLPAYLAVLDPACSI